MTLVEHAKYELCRLEGKGKDHVEDVINQQALELVEQFSLQGHSEISANHLINILIRLLRFKPLTPLTGEDDEWSSPSSVDGVQQNKRYSSVFKYPDGRVEDISAIYVSTNGGHTWSLYPDERYRKYVTFPYMPDTLPEYKYIEYTDDGIEDITGDAARIKKLYDYYCSNKDIS